MQTTAQKASLALRKLTAECARLKAINERYRDALLYARGQSDRHNQIRGIEDETYFAWINERCSKALRLRKANSKDEPRRP